MFKQLIEQVSSIGVKEFHEPHEVKYITLSNLFILSFFFIGIAYVPLIWIFYPESEPLLYYVLFPTFIWLIGLLLNHRGMFNTSRVFICFFGVSLISLNAICGGLEYDITLFYLVNLLTAFLLFPYSHKKWMIFCVSNCFAAIVFVEIWSYFVSPVFAYTETFLQAQRYGVWIGVFGYLTALAAYNYNLLHKSDVKINQQKTELSEKNKEIVDSINYAKQIQTAILPKPDFISKTLKDYFILYQPKDIVSGDFYWFAHEGDHIVIAAADCTGHGVPGAFMSMIGSDLLNHIVIENGETEAAEILNQLRLSIVKALHQEREDSVTKDGMDIALCSINLKKKELQFAGAFNPLYQIRNKELNVVIGDKFPIGKHSGTDFPFKNHIIQLEAGDSFYIFSDGYIDQFGGPNGKKFMAKRFRELLLDINLLDMKDQGEALRLNIEEWIGKRSQIDDILVIGFRV